MRHRFAGRDLRAKPSASKRMEISDRALTLLVAYSRIRLLCPREKIGAKSSSILIALHCKFFRFLEWHSHEALGARGRGLIKISPAFRSLLACGANIFVLLGAGRRALGAHRRRLRDSDHLADKECHEQKRGKNRNDIDDAFAFAGLRSE